jgi:ketosteroid isomerase-like protein
VDVALERRIRDGYAAFLRGELDRALEQFLPDATFTNPDYAIEAGVRRGREELRSGFRALYDGFDYAAIAVDELTEGPGGVLAVVRVSARGKGSGAPFEGTFAHVFRLHDGRVVDFAWFATPDEGRRAAGLG